MRTLIVTVIIIFCLGWASSMVYSSMAAPAGSGERPSSEFSIFGLLKGSGSPATEVDSPFDRISEDQIHVYDDRVIIDLKGAEWAGFTDTNSMDPIIDDGSNAIQVRPKSPDEIHVGDIVSYASSFTDATIIHRVVRIGQDDKGWYAVMKGDNLNKEDPEHVRFDQIRRVLVAIIY